jgi:hypothetical protein
MGNSSEDAGPHDQGEQGHYQGSATRSAEGAGPTRRAKRWLRWDEAVACRNGARSGTASLASAETSASPCALRMTTSSHESSRYSAIRIPASQRSGWNHNVHNAPS